MLPNMTMTQLQLALAATAFKGAEEQKKKYRDEEGPRKMAKVVLEQIQLQATQRTGAASGEFAQFA